MKLVLRPTFLRIFFAVAACSWMPHWACHYYRLETGSGFVVGSWSFSVFDSAVSIGVYTVLIILNLIAIQFESYRLVASGLTAIGHLVIGSLHVYRLIHPFTFEVFGYRWSYGASLREVFAVMPIGVVAFVVAFSLKSEA